MFLLLYRGKPLAIAFALMQLTRVKYDRNTNEPKRISRVVFIFDVRPMCFCRRVSLNPWIVYTHKKKPATSRHCSYVYDTSITRHRQYDVYNTTWTTRSRFLTKVTMKTLWSFRDGTCSANFQCYIATKHVFARFLNQKIHIYKEIKKIQSRHTADPKWKVQQSRPSERPGNN